MKATVRALYSAVDVVGLEGDTLVVSAPSEMHKKKCLELKDHVCTALTAAAGRPIDVDVRVQASRSVPTVAAASKSVTSPKEANLVSDHVSDHGTDHSSDEIDNNDAPAESVVDHIAKQFPGARIVDNTKK